MQALVRIVSRLYLALDATLRGGVFTLQLILLVDDWGFRFRQVDRRFRRFRGDRGVGFRRVGGEKRGR